MSVSPHDGHADAADGPVDPRSEDDELEGEAARPAHRPRAQECHGHHYGVS